MPVKALVSLSLFVTFSVSIYTSNYNKFHVDHEYKNDSHIFVFQSNNITLLENFQKVKNSFLNFTNIHFQINICERNPCETHLEHFKP